MSLLIVQSNATLYRQPIIGETQERDSNNSETSQTQLSKKTPEEFNAIIRSQIHANKTDEDVSELEGDPEEIALQRKKTQAREDIQRLREEFKVIKEVWANDPKEMARQLGRIAKQLKAAVKMFSDASKALGEIGQSAPSMTTMTAGSNISSASETDEQAEDQPPTKDDIDNTVEDAERSAQNGVDLSEQNMDGTDSSVSALASQRNAAQAAYSEQVEKVDIKWVKAKDSPQYAAYMDNMNFINEVRGFSKLLELEFEHTKKKAVFTIPDKAEKSEEFEEADKEFEELLEDVIDFERDVKAAMPIPGTLVSVAA